MNKNAINEASYPWAVVAMYKLTNAVNIDTGVSATELGIGDVLYGALNHTWDATGGVMEAIMDPGPEDP